ncbi:MAG: hypothetical protein HKM95_10435 [Inquilinus sp.]|nr:hypothetical protein [Inquilinus sp.]
MVGREFDPPAAYGPFWSTGKRLALFAALALVCAFIALPSRRQEEALLDVGQRICEHIVTGAPVNEKERWRGVGWSAPRLIQRQVRLRPEHSDRLRPYFAEQCRAKFWRGDFDVGGDSDYVLYISDGDGNFLILSLRARKFFPNMSFEILGMGASWLVVEPSAQP